MITNEQELMGRRERIVYFERVLAQLRATATPEEFPSVASGYRVELERMQTEVVDYLTQPLDAPSRGMAV